MSELAFLCALCVSTSEGATTTGKFSDHGKWMSQMPSLCALSVSPETAKDYMSKRGGMAANNVTFSSFWWLIYRGYQRWKNTDHQLHKKEGYRLWDGENTTRTIGITWRNGGWPPVSEHQWFLTIAAARNLHKEWRGIHTAPDSTKEDMQPAVQFRRMRNGGSNDAKNIVQWLFG